MSVLEMLNPMHRLLVGRPLEQAHARARLLLEEVHVLRRVARLHRPLRPTRHRLVLAAHPGADRRDGRDAAFTSSTRPRRRPACARSRSGCIDEKLSITWWGNIRFEKTFTPELCQLLAQSGCVAVSGGLEVASDRLLQLMKKGVTVEQVARVTRAFTDAGIMVHAYLMYGFPTETDAGDDRRARARAAAVRRGLHPVGVLAPLRGDGALAHRAEPGAYGITLRPPPASRSRTTTWRSTIPSAPITTSSARACARRSTTTCTASGSTRTCASGSRRRQRSPRRAHACTSATLTVARSAWI